LQLTLFGQVEYGNSKTFDFSWLFGYIANIPTKRRWYLDKKSTAKYAAKATIIKAMAHPTRLLIIEELSKQEHCVCELTEMIGADVSTVSKHLTVLKNAGIIRDEKRSQMVYYHMIMPCTLNFMSCLDKVLHDKAKAQLALIA
jgi:ArsR family transcriptional regulator